MTGLAACPGKWMSGNWRPCAAPPVSRRSTVHEAVLRPRVQPRRAAGDRPNDRTQPPSQTHAAVAPGVRAVELVPPCWPARRDELSGGDAAHADAWPWNEPVARCHCPGCTPMAGSPIRYRVHAGDRRVALPSCGAGAWKLADGERFIGWSQSGKSVRGAGQSSAAAISRPIVVVPPADRANGSPPCMRAIAATMARPRPWLASLCRRELSTL